MNYLVTSKNIKIVILKNKAKMPSIVRIFKRKEIYGCCIVS